MKSKLSYTFILLALSLPACNDWLDIRPQTEISAKEMFTTEDGFKDALTACYIKLNSSDLYGRRLIVTDIEWLANHWTGNNLDVTVIKNFDYESAYAQNTFTTIYGGLYNTIVQANILLENLLASEEVISKSSLRAVIEAEALSIRAFCHFEVLRLFGQVPQNARQQVSLPYAGTVSIAAVPYYAFDDFLSRVLRDLEAAEKLLEGHDPILDYTYEQLNNFADASSSVTLDDPFLGYRRFRFNYYAVKALQARVYLYTGQRGKAYTTAKGLIDARDEAGNKVLSLAGSNDFNERYYALPSECILALSNFKLTDIQNLFIAAYPTLYLTMDQFTNDLFAGQSTSVNNRATNVWNTSTAYIGGSIRPTIRKYEQPDASESVTSNVLATRRQVVPLIRLSELYLIAMETSTDIAEVNALYTEYMQARNVVAATLTEAQVMDEIVKEYRREFFGEGQMFYTYKRLGTTRMLWKTDRDVTEIDYVVPLPTSEFNANN
jgi:hypothetical protein